MEHEDLTQEIKWWDHWNTSARADKFTLESSAGRTGLLALEEVRRLQLSAPAVLEVGAGTGWLAAQAVGWSRYVGLDLSPVAVQVARERVPNARFFVADFHHWECDPGSFDVVIMVDTIAYFRDQDLVMRKAREALRPGGWLIVTTVNPIVYSRMSWIGAPGEGQVRKWLTRRALHDLLKRNGFSPRRSYTAFPDGDRGFLRLLNSRRIERLFFRGAYPAWMNKLKEFAGLGQYRIVVAQCTTSPSTHVENAGRR